MTLEEFADSLTDGGTIDTTSGLIIIVAVKSYTKSEIVSYLNTADVSSNLLTTVEGMKTSYFKMNMKTTSKYRAAEYDSSSSLPWILGGVGVLLIGGAAYWFFTKKVSKKGKK